MGVCEFLQTRLDETQECHHSHECQYWQQNQCERIERHAESRHLSNECQRDQVAGYCSEIDAGATVRFRHGDRAGGLQVEMLRGCERGGRPEARAETFCKCGPGKVATVIRAVIRRPRVAIAVGRGVGVTSGMGHEEIRRCHAARCGGTAPRRHEDRWCSRRVPERMAERVRSIRVWDWDHELDRRPTVIYDDLGGVAKRGRSPRQPRRLPVLRLYAGSLPPTQARRCSRCRGACSVPQTRLGPFWFRLSGASDVVTTLDEIKLALPGPVSRPCHALGPSTGLGTVAHPSDKRWRASTPRRQPTSTRRGSRLLPIFEPSTATDQVVRESETRR